MPLEWHTINQRVKSWGFKNKMTCCKYKETSKEKKSKNSEF